MTERQRPIKMVLVPPEESQHLLRPIVKFDPQSILQAPRFSGIPIQSPEVARLARATDDFSEMRTWAHWPIIEKYLGDNIKDKVSLDIGCAPGDLVKKFEDAGAHAFGIDISESRVNVARRISGLLHRENIKHADVRDLPFKDGTVDYVTSQANLGPEAEAFQMNCPESAAEIARVLKPGGLFFVMEDDADLTHFEEAGLKEFGGDGSMWYILQKPINPVERL
ncbi:MAG: class I SAM-dependent methyltransferase [Candidatus Altiarchaeota archaeon]